MHVQYTTEFMIKFAQTCKYTITSNETK